MKCDEILKKLEEEYPLSVAEEWDNPGLLIGHRDWDVHKVLVALDATEATIREAIEMNADLIVTHHPLLFHRIRSVSSDTFLGRRILAMIENNIACYAMHTNFDVLGMSRLNEDQLNLQHARVLQVTGETDGIEEGLGRVGEWDTPRTLCEAADYVRKQLHVDAVRCYGLEDIVEGEPERLYTRVAVCGGSGKSMVPYALEEGAEILVTGDIDYHTAIDALAQGLFIIDAGHFGTEFGFVSYMTQKMRRLFPDLIVEEAKEQPPYKVITKQEESK